MQQPSFKKIEEWQRENPKRPFFSLEFFPPKTETGVLNLYDRFDRFSTLHPRWVDITWAGGSTSTRTLEICANALRYHGLEPLMHLACRTMSEEALEDTLRLVRGYNCLSEHEAVTSLDLSHHLMHDNLLILGQCMRDGIRNILALRGDSPLEDTSDKSKHKFRHAVDLIKFIRDRYGKYFCIAAAGYPEGHLENPNKDDDLKCLKEKIDAGADLILTQLFFQSTITDLNPSDRCWG